MSKLRLIGFCARPEVVRALAGYVDALRTAEELYGVGASYTYRKHRGYAYRIDADGGVRRTPLRNDKPSLHLMELCDRGGHNNE